MRAMASKPHRALSGARRGAPDAVLARRARALRAEARAVALPRGTRLVRRSDTCGDGNTIGRRSRSSRSARGIVSPPPGSTPSSIDGPSERSFARRSVLRAFFVRAGDDFFAATGGANHGAVLRIASHACVQ